MSEQKPTEHTDTPKTARTAPSMASMAAAIHAAPVRAPKKSARASQTSGEKPGDASTTEPSSKRRNAHKNSSRKNNASRPENQKRERRKNHRDRAEQRPYNPLIPAVITYPEELPVSERREDIKAAIRDHQVIIVAGETGSGKTTQLPKMCLELGLAEKGMIGHTQP
ncbi:MAG: ATP-dependent helicase, partial [Rothia aeria]